MGSRKLPWAVLVSLSCLAVFFPLPASPCPAVFARRALEDYFARGGAGLPDSTLSDTAPARPLFVTYARRGRTRGCAGSFQPLFPTLGEELAYFAVQAATRDFRHPSMTVDDLEEVTVMVTFPGEPVPASSLAAFDPRRHGLMVVRDGRAGVVLAREAKTVSFALRRALADAGIENGENVEYYIFECLTIVEEEGE